MELGVPYKSQWDSDASETRDDCGPACVAMILNYYGENLTTNEVFKRTGAGADQMISISQMQKAITFFGYTSQFEIGKSWEDVRGLLASKNPPILLIHYGPLSSRQDKGFSGGHFVVCTGEDADAWYINDPDFWGQFRQDGDGHRYLKNEMELAWAECAKDDNPPYSYLVINRKGQELEACWKDREKFWKERNAAYLEIDALKKQVASADTTLEASLAKKDVECQAQLEQQKKEFFIEQERITDTHRKEIEVLNDKIKQLQQGLPVPVTPIKTHTHPDWIYKLGWAKKGDEK